MYEEQNGWVTGGIIALIVMGVLSMAGCGAAETERDQSEIQQRQQECTDAGGKFTYEGTDYGSYTFNCTIEPTGSPSESPTTTY